MLGTKLKPQTFLHNFPEMLNNSTAKKMQRVNKLIGDKLSDDPGDLTSSIDSLHRSYCIMDFLHRCNVQANSKKQQWKIEFFNSLKKMLID